MYATDVHVYVVRINNYTIMYKLNEPYPTPHSNNWTVPSTSFAARERFMYIFRGFNIYFYFKMKVMFEIRAY